MKCNIRAIDMQITSIFHQRHKEREDESQSPEGTIMKLSGEIEISDAE